MVIRRNRFNEKKNDQVSIDKSRFFEKETLNYITNSMKYFTTKITNPRFFIFSDNTEGLNSFFSDYDNCTVINHTVNKPINDFYLSTLCNHFIVGPSTFHWWSAYLSKYQNKICVRPPDILKFSSNKDIFPKTWINLKA